MSFLYMEEALTGEVGFHNGKFVEWWSDQTRILNLIADIAV